MSIHVLRPWFGQHTCLPASYRINHTKEAMSTKDLDHNRTVNGKFFLLDSHFQQLGLEPCCASALAGAGASTVWHVLWVPELHFWSCWCKRYYPPYLQGCCSLSEWVYTISNFQLHVPHHVWISKQKKSLATTARLTNSCAVAAALSSKQPVIFKKGWV